MARNIIFLYTRFADYFYQSLLFFLRENPEYKAIVIRYPADPNAPFEFIENEQLEILDKRGFKEVKEIIKFVEGRNPVAIYNSGWSDPDYLQVAQHFYRAIPTIVGLDNPWKGNFRQYLGIIKFKLFMSKSFSHIWVAGKPQFEFAKRLGYTHTKILNELYSANSKLFHSQYEHSLITKTKNYPRKLLFIGRYVDYKQPLLLVEVFNELLQSNLTNGWTLELIGSGQREKEMKAYENENIQINSFISPKDLPKKLSQAGAFCLPSRNEHWGVVVHEAVSAGLPVLLSNTTYAATEFLIENFNGYQFKEDCREDFRKKLIQFFSKTDAELIEMGKNSNYLSKKISQQGWAANLSSVL